jgi:hypothetical protein
MWVFRSGVYLESSREACALPLDIAVNKSYGYLEGQENAL